MVRSVSGRRMGLLARRGIAAGRGTVAAADIAAAGSACVEAGLEK